MSKIESHVAAHERVANENGRSHRELYTSHREQLTALLLRACPKAGGRLALLGAGNCNDVDLQALLSVCGEVHLVDIDRQAIASARGQLAEDLQPKVFLHAPVDLSGLLNVWEAARTKSPTFAEIDSWPARGSQNVQNALPGPFDLVASCCVLTQMSWGLRQSLGKNHPFETQAREALVAAHLRSNQGANPVLVRRLLRRDSELSSSVKSAAWLSPWLWQGPKERTYLVYALELECTVG